MPSQTKKYLIVGPSWVGDMVMAQSLFIDIKKREPTSQIDVLAPEWTAALINRMPEVATLISGKFQHGKLNLIDRIRLGKGLREKRYTNAILLPNSFKSALVPAIARIPIRTGFIGEQRWGVLNDIRKLDKNELPMTVQRFLALGSPPSVTVRDLTSIPAPLLQVTDEDKHTVLKKNQLSLTQPVLALCPGAEFGSSKQWPAEHYATVAKHYTKLGWQVWLMGSKNDLAVCQDIDNLVEHTTTVLAGKTTLPEAIDLMSCATLVVSNDSGLMHIAAALQKTLVAVYGSTDPGHTPPLSHNHAIARLNLNCSPCFKRDCPLEHLNCLRELMPENIVSLSESLL